MECSGKRSCAFLATLGVRFNQAKGQKIKLSPGKELNLCWEVFFNSCKMLLHTCGGSGSHPGFEGAGSHLFTHFVIFVL
jgi:hypothetical protein